jgi:hypothetical protein
MFEPLNLPPPAEMVPELGRSASGRVMSWPRHGFGVDLQQDVLTVGGLGRWHVRAKLRNHALVCLSWMGKDFVGRPMTSIGVGNSFVPPNRRAGSLRGRDGRLCGRRVLAAAEDAEP